MLERKVLIDGTVYDRHELVMVTIQPSSPEIVTVRSSHSDGDDTMTETAHECELSDTVDFAEWEEAVWALPAFEEWTDTAAGLDEVLAILTDEQAETVTALFPKWRVGVEYKKDARVQYDEKLYRCVQAHTSSAEYTPLVHSLWTRTAAEGEIPDWVQPEGSHDAYDKGDKVKHNSKTWESTYDGANVWEPGVYGWEEVTQ